jgi:hypothetical protein
MVVCPNIGVNKKHLLIDGKLLREDMQTNLFLASVSGKKLKRTSLGAQPRTKGVCFCLVN